MLGEKKLKLVSRKNEWKMSEWNRLITFSGNGGRVLEAILIKNCSVNDSVKRHIYRF